MVSSIRFEEQARSPQYNGIKYDQLDCQAFVEKVLYDSGCRKSNGSSYNWKGSNDMWRNALSWKGTIDECKKVYGEIPLGAWVFIWANDGGEKDRGYNDNQGNAKHVGIYVGADTVRDSTRNTSGRDGVGYRKLEGFNRVGLCKYLDYEADNKDNTYEILTILDHIRSELDNIERMVLNE